MDYGLALSGGGPRGAAHVGVLKALEENKLLPTSISGTSAGSVAAALFAYGYPIDKLISVVEFLSENGKKVIDPNIFGFISAIPKMIIKAETNLSGILLGKNMEKYFKSLFDEKLIKEINMPLVIPAVDILSGKTIAFTNYINGKPSLPNVIWNSNAKLYEIVRASCSIPGVFAPKAIGDMVLVDGGLTNNLPVDLLRASGTKKVIGVDISSDYYPPNQINITETLSSSFKIMQKTLKDSLSRTEILLLTPPLPKSSNLFCFKCMEESMEIGYDFTIKNISRIRSVLF